MAEAFNLNNFLREQATYNQRQYTAIENGKAAMEARAIEKAQEAIAQTGFLGITLSEKMAELGVGERVIQQLGDTAVNAIENIVSPISDYLAKYEHIYDENVYNAEIQAMGKQMFFARQALAQEAALAEVGQNFVYNM